MESKVKSDAEVLGEYIDIDKFDADELYDLLERIAVRIVDGMEQTMAVELTLEDAGIADACDTEGC